MCSFLHPVHNLRVTCPDKMRACPRGHVDSKRGMGAALANAGFCSKLIHQREGCGARARATIKTHPRVCVRLRTQRTPVEQLAKSWRCSGGLASAIHLQSS